MLIARVLHTIYVKPVQGSSSTRVSVFLASVLDLIGGGAGGSRATTPVSMSSSRKSPTMDQGTQVGHKDEKKVRPIQPPGHRNNYQQRDRRDSRGEGSQQQQKQQGGMQQQHRPQYHNQMQRGGEMHHQQRGPDQHRPDQQQMGHQMGQQRQPPQGNWTTRGQHQQPRQRGRGRNGPPGSFRPPHPQGQPQVCFL